MALSTDPGLSASPGTVPRRHLGVCLPFGKGKGVELSGCRACCATWVPCQKATEYLAASAQTLSLEIEGL